MPKEQTPVVGIPAKCRFCGKKALPIDYKDVGILQKYASPQGKIFDRKRTNTCAKHQRELTRAIKRARFLALMKFSGV